MKLWLWSALCSSWVPWSSSWAGSHCGPWVIMDTGHCGHCCHWRHYCQFGHHGCHGHNSQCETNACWGHLSHLGLFSSWAPCLVPVRRFPSHSRSIHLGDVSEANGRETPSHFRLDHIIRNALAARNNDA